MRAINPQALELLATIEAENISIAALLSNKGKSAYFPQQGILAQAAEAAHCTINATIGIALNEDTTPAILPSLAEQTLLSDEEVFQYAPSAGLPALRKTWKTMLAQKNPTLASKEYSTPVVTCALTHGIFIVGQLLLDEGDQIITPDYYWENYDLVLSESTGASLVTYPTFTTDGGYNIAALDAAIAKGGIGKKILILNFPNNPTGYTPTITEAHALRDMLLRHAEAGSAIAVLIDDAYFGLVFEPSVYTESLFSLLCDLHTNLLAIKIDGPTKEDYVWGLRTGFITYGTKNGSAKLYSVLEAKTAGLIRGSISNAPKISQSLLLRTYLSPTYEAEKAEKNELLTKRYKAVKKALADHPEYATVFEALPYNSGYFMCVRSTRGISSELIRQELVTTKHIGLIQISGLLRIAFSSTPTDKLASIFQAIYEVCLDLEKRA